MAATSVVVLVALLTGYFALSRVGAGTQPPSLEVAACPFDIPSGLSEGESLICGYVTVPLRHDTPDGPTTRLAVARFPSSASHPEPDPLVLVRGGPGESTLTVFAPVVASSIGERFLEQRDIVLIELRGTYYSEPSLDCPEWDAFIDDRLSRDIRSGEELRLDIESIRRCHERLQSQGIDLSAFNTVESAADIPSVMSALGYREFNLFATSASTLIAQHLMRDQPDNLRSVILDSPLPLDERPYADFVIGANESLTGRFAACDNDARCRDAYPDLAGSLTEAIERFNREPVTVSIVNLSTDEPADVVLNGDRVAELVYGMLSDSEAVPALPLVIEMLAEGDTALAPTFGGALFHPEHFSRGLQYSALCAEEITFAEAEIGIPGEYPSFETVVAALWPRKLLAGCEFWSVERLPPVVDEPVSSNVPTLIVSGQFDILPASYGPGLERSLSQAQLVTVPGAAHTPTGSGDCSLDIAEEFFNQPDSAVDSACLNTIEVRFIVEPFARRLLLSTPPVLRLALLVVPLLLMLSLLVTALWRRFRTDRSGPDRTRRLLLVATGLNLLFVVLFFASNPLEILYGSSTMLRTASWLPLVSLFLVVAAGALLIVDWRRLRARPPGALYNALIALAILVFVWQLDWWFLLAR